MAVAEAGRDLKQPCEPKSAAEPINAAEWHIGHEVDAARERENGHKHDHEKASHEKVHILPTPGIGDVSREEITHLHGTEDEDVEDRKEHAEIALGRNPELDDTHALESSLNLTEARQEAQSPKARQIGSQRSKELAEHETGRRPEK